jgi:hypothetical protein
MAKLIAALLAAALIGAGHADARAEQPGLSAPGSSQFNFLRGSTWYVPPQTLPAAQLMLDSGLVEGVIDQTVWQITDYSAGYFWGYSIAMLKRMATGEQIGSTSCSRLLGSVTPAGHVHIAFVPQGDHTTSKSTIGTGYFQNVAPQGWTFEMQTSTGATFVLAHWSYMYQCKAGQPCESRLPGTTMSLSQFVSQCSFSAPRQSP